MSIENGRLVLIDLDETLIDTQYQLTDAGIYGAINEAQSKGLTIGLNSNTPFQGLAIWRERLGMNGPIIAENGAVVSGDDGTPQFDEQEAVQYRIAQKAVAKRLGTLGVSTWSGNPVEALRKGVRFGESGQTVALINNLRQCSLSFFVRVVDQDGSFIIDNRETERISDLVGDLYPDFDDAVLDINPEYGIIIAGRQKNNKYAGGQKLRSLLNYTGTFDMIGNSMGDYLGDLANHYAVANATEEYQKMSGYIASQPLTSGVIEILEMISRQSGDSV